MNLRPHPKEPPDINLTPLIDVVFLLLIFFMVSTTFKEDARIRVQLPEAQGEAVPAEDPEEPRPLEILIDGSGNFYLDQRMVADRTPETLRKAIVGTLGPHLQDDREQVRAIPVIIKADAQTPHQAVMTAMDVASQLGLLRFAIAATRPDSPPAPTPSPIRSQAPR